MKRTTSTKVMWRVQARKSRAHKWQHKGLFETRAAARQEADHQRYNSACWEDIPHQGYGFGNTRVVRYVKGEK